MATTDSVGKPPRCEGFEWRRSGRGWTRLQIVRRWRAVDGSERRSRVYAGYFTPEALEIYRRYLNGLAESDSRLGV
jgi:hypothetical protein